MNTQPQQEATIHEFELSEACVCCGGTVSARFTPGNARGICLNCHLVTPIALFRTEDGVRIVQQPVAQA